MMVLPDPPGPFSKNLNKMSPLNWLLPVLVHLPLEMKVPKQSAANFKETYVIYLHAKSI